MKPILRWAGGKRWLVDQLIDEIKAVQPERYVEPFLGGGAIALALKASQPMLRLVLSDGSTALMNLWKQIQVNPDGVAVTARRLYDRYGNTKDGYLTVRTMFNSRPAFGLQSAAQMIYLNALCFNGLWRENSKGHMNTPFGDVKNPRIASREDLEALSDLLATASLTACDFRKPLETIRDNDAVYADPPYHAGYVSYTATGFSEEDQTDLAELLRLADERGANVWASNSNTPLIQELYAWADVEPIHEARNIAAKAQDRAAAPCVLIRSRRLRASQV